MGTCTEMRGVSPDALGKMAASLKLLVSRAEQALRTANTAGESWPVDSLAVWAPDGGGPQAELHMTNRWRRPDSHTLIRRRSHGEQHARTIPTAHTHPHLHQSMHLQQRMETTACTHRESWYGGRTQACSICLVTLKRPRQCL